LASNAHVLNHPAGQVTNEDISPALKLRRATEGRRGFCRGRAAQVGMVSRSSRRR